tara:strand:- start:293 stop:631 length:339 start_codon:yes stop_codon:yes gene_type:complete
MIKNYSTWDCSIEQYLYIENEIIGYLSTIKDSCWDIGTIIQLTKMNYVDVKHNNISKIKFKNQINKMLFMVNSRQTKQSGKEIAEEIFQYKLYKEKNKNENKIRNKTRKRLC